MTTNEIRTSIKTVYGKLWDVLALYESTECYNVVPEGSAEKDIWDYMGTMLLDIRKEISTLFLGNDKLEGQLIRIVDETEYFVRSYERPGVVKRWKKLNPRLLYFDCSFDVMEEMPEVYREISRGFHDLKLSCYPDEELTKERNLYVKNTKEKIRTHNLRYSPERVFQDELLRTLTLVFEHDLGEYL